MRISLKEYRKQLVRIWSIIRHAFFFHKIVNISLTIILILVLLLSKRSPRMHPNETALFYFFSSLAQSMAAIIALAGTIAIFRYSFMVDKLKSARNHIRDRFDTQGWRYHFGVTDSKTWHDDEVLEKAEAFRTANSTAQIYKELMDCIEEVSTLELNMVLYLSHLQRSAISTTTTFILSLTFIPLSSWIATNKIGTYVIVIFSFMAFISNYSISCGR